MDSEKLNSKLRLERVQDKLLCVCSLQHFSFSSNSLYFPSFSVTTKCKILTSYNISLPLMLTYIMYLTVTQHESERDTTGRYELRFRIITLQFLLLFFVVPLVEIGNSKVSHQSTINIKYSFF